LNLIFDMS